MISDLTAVPEIGKTYLGKVVRLAEFGAFVEIFPGTDGLLHVSEIAEHRVKEVKDELREGDQILVKVLAIEGNRIKLSRKAVLREQRAKLGLPEPGQIGTDGGRVEAVAAAPRAEQVSDEVDEDGDDFDEDGEETAEEPNFNRADGVPAVAAVAGGGQGANGPGGQRRPGGRRRRGGRRPGSGPGGPQGGGNR
jgi:polyribonucleotide nucleotidyltransferase